MEDKFIKEIDFKCGDISVMKIWINLKNKYLNGESTKKDLIDFKSNVMNIYEKMNEVEYLENQIKLVEEKKSILDKEIDEGIVVGFILLGLIVYGIYNLVIWLWGKV